MVSISKAKELLWNYADNYTDEEIEKIVSLLRAVSHIVLDAYLGEEEKE